MFPTDAVLLNNIVQNFGMLDLVKKVLASHKCQMDRSREQYARDLAGNAGLSGQWVPSVAGVGPYEHGWALPLLLGALRSTLSLFGGILPGVLKLCFLAPYGAAWPGMKLGTLGRL